MQVYNQSAKNPRTRGTITPKAKKIFKELFSSGFTQTEIAKEYNVPVGTVGSIVKPRIKSHYNPKVKLNLTLPKQAITVERKVVEETAVTKLILKREQLLNEVAAINQAIEILKGL